jgi:ribosome-binding factor A
MSQKSRRTRSQFAKSDTSTHSTGGLPDEGAGHRQARLEHILLDELQALINDEATDPSLDGIKILAVHLSADGGHARVAYAVAALLSSEQEVGRASKDGLVRATGFLRARLAEQLHLKKLPKLTFTFVGIAQVGNHKATGGDESGGEPCPE